MEDIRARARFVYTGVINRGTRGHGAHNSLWSLTIVELYHSHAFQRTRSANLAIDTRRACHRLDTERHDYGRMQPELTMGRYSPPRIGQSGPSDAGGTGNAARTQAEDSGRMVGQPSPTDIADG
jgi:hypothetical protein